MGIEVYGTVARKFFRFAKTVIIVQRNNLKKILSYKTKLTFLWRFWVNFFFNFGGNFRPSRQNFILRGLGSFWGKTLFELLDIVSKFFGLWAKNVRVSFGKKSLRVVTTAIRASRGLFCGKSFLFPENFCFFYQIWCSSEFFLLFGKYLI